MKNPLRELPAGGVKRLLFSPRLPFVLLWTYMAVCHIMFIMGRGDDGNFATVLEGQGLWGYTTWSFWNWSSRQLVDVLMIVVNGLPHLVWQLVNPLVITALCWGLAGLARVRGNAGACWVLCGFMVLYPWQVMDSAGWVTTTTVFLWPCTAAVLALNVVLRVVWGHRVHPAVQALAVLGLLYAANMEQVLIVLLIVLGGLLAGLLVQKRWAPWLVWAALGAALAQLLYIALNPGNRLRVEVETTNWYPNFGMKGLFSKVELGASSALEEVFLARNFIFFFFLLLLAWAVFLRRREILFRLGALVPVVVCAVLGMYGARLEGLLPQLGLLRGAVTTEGIISLVNVNSLAGFVPLLLLYGCAFLTLVNLYLAFGHTAESLGVLLGFGAGLASRLAMGFSPTVWTSGARTSLPWQLATIAVGVMLYRDIAPAAKRWQKFVFFAVFMPYCLFGLYNIQEMRLGSGY